MKIGCIGWGFIGKSVAHAFGNDNEIDYFSLSDKSCTMKEMAQKSEIIFVALPTPMNLQTRRCDLSIIESRLKELADDGFKGIVVIKSTILPGSCEKWTNDYGIRIVFSPEFLTARSAKLDFINSSRHIFGGQPEDVKEVVALYKTRFLQSQIFETDWKTAEFIKYMCNNFFATKVIFMNMMYKVAEKMGMDWDVVLPGFLTDQRIGNSHYQVPGHDGDFGFGGYCFPKDINAFIFWLKDNDCEDEAEFFEIVWKLNLKYRINRDWEHLESAVSNG